MIESIVHHSGSEWMGFVKQSPPVRLQCRFYALKVYSLVGITFDSEEGAAIGRLNECCMIGMGNDINDLSVKITGKAYCDDPNVWLGEKRVIPCFLMTLTSNNIDYSNSCKWIKDCEDEILTYDCFANSKSDLDKCVAKYEIPYIPLISAYLTRGDNLVRVNHLEAHYYGETSDRKLIRDSKVSAIGEVGLLDKISLKESFTGILDKFTDYKPPGERFSSLIYASMQEKDAIKSFIFAWTAVEILVNKYHKENCTVEEFPCEGLGEFELRISKLFQDPKRGRRITAITHKFAYSTIFCWTFLNTSDYDLFVGTKQMRDRFTHGVQVNTVKMPQVTQSVLALIGKIIKNL